MKINLIVQLILRLANIGRYYLAVRYMGTFNDPNQFAYFILITYCLIFLFGLKYRSSTFIYLLISIFLIIESGSTGMLLGIGVFLAFSVLESIKKLPSFLAVNKKRILGIVYVGLAIISFYELYNIVFPKIDNNRFINFKDIKIFQRVEEKFHKANKDEGNLWQERGYDKIFCYPQYILYGAGEGYNMRFTKTDYKQEIHATFPSILFYYGIIPLFILLVWIYKKIKGVKGRALIVYIALFAESFTLLNQRQALFWIIILLASVMKKDRGIENEEN